MREGKPEGNHRRFILPAKTNKNPISSIAAAILLTY